MDTLRSFLRSIDEQEDLVRIDEPISAVYEMAAVIEQAGTAGGPAVVFSQVAGYPGYEVAANLFGTRRRVAAALGVPEVELGRRFLALRQQRIPPQLVNDGPVRERVVVEGPDLVAEVPVVTHYEKDSAPYVTAGVVVARDPESGHFGMGVHRIQVIGPNRATVLLASPPLADFLRAAERRGQPLEVTVVLGCDPSLTLAAVSRVEAHEDKLEVAGGLGGAPVDLLPGLTVSVPAPANAEIVFEGRILPGVREQDGPFGESTGYYYTFHSPVIEVTAISRRQRPVYQAILPWAPEVDLLMEVTVGSQIFRKLHAQVPEVRDLRMSVKTCGLQAVLVMEPTSPRVTRRALYLALTVDQHIKQAIAVDEDVDPSDPAEVGWAVTTRVDPERDLLLLPGLEGYVIDPQRSAADDAVTKWGIDATLPPGARESCQRIRLEPAAATRAQALWRKWAQGR